MGSEGRTLVTATPEESIRTLAIRMREEDVGCVVVVDEDQPIGIITDRDVAVRVVRKQLDPESTKARDLVGDDLITELPDTSSFELLRIMRENRIRRIPLVEDGKLVELVTMDDLIVKLTDELRRLADVVQSKSTDLLLETIR